MYKIIEPRHVYVTCKQHMSNIQLKQDNMNDKPNKILDHFQTYWKNKL